MDSKKPPVKKSKVKKSKAKKPKPKPKPKTKQKQKQVQTQNVIINLSDIRKRTRRKMTTPAGKRPLPLSAFSGSAQTPVYVNPQGSAYRDLIRPLKEQQREMRANAQDDLRRSEQQREQLRGEFTRSQAGQSAINRELVKKLMSANQAGNIETPTPAPVVGDLEIPTPPPSVGVLEDSEGESSSVPDTVEDREVSKTEEIPKMVYVRKNPEQDKVTRKKRKDKIAQTGESNIDVEQEVKNPPKTTTTDKKGKKGKK